MIFYSIKENKEYFTGFFAVAFTSLCLTTANLLNIELKIVSLIIIFLLALRLGDSLITQRIEQLRQEGFNSIKDSHIVALRLKLLEKDLREKQLAAVEIKRHRRECRSENCFCR